MSLSDRIKPISYLKAHASEVIRTLKDQQGPLIVTQNGEAKAVVQDIDSYERMAGEHRAAQDACAWQPSD